MARWTPAIRARGGFVDVPEMGAHGPSHTSVRGGFLTEYGARPGAVQGGWFTESGARPGAVQGGWFTESGSGFVTIPESGAKTCAQLAAMGADNLEGEDWEAFLECPPSVTGEATAEADDPCGFLSDSPELYAQCAGVDWFGGGEDDAGGVEASGGMSDDDALKWGAQAGEYFGTATDLILGLLGKQGGTVPPPTDVPAGGVAAVAPSPYRRVLPIAAGIAAVGGIIYFVSRKGR